MGDALVDAHMVLTVDRPGSARAGRDTHLQMSDLVRRAAGSAGFDDPWIALHHSGRARHDEVIPIATIAEHLRAAGHAALMDT